MFLLLFLLLLLPHAASSLLINKNSSPTCSFDGSITQSGPTYLYLKDCDMTDLTQRWILPPPASSPGPIFNQNSSFSFVSSLQNSPANTYPVADYENDKTTFTFTSAGQIEMKTAAPRTPSDKGVGACFDIYGGSGPNINYWECHTSDSPDFVHQQVSEREFWKTRILAMKCAKWLQMATSTTKLTYPIRLARLFRSSFIKNAPRFSRPSLYMTPPPSKSSPSQT